MNRLRIPGFRVLMGSAVEGARGIDGESIVPPSLTGIPVSIAE
ncbi:hypothetical protein ACQP2U_40015 [Nocardia sp. CA-084685]